MNNVTVKRTGRSPLRFTGELLADCDTSSVAGKERTRWFSANVYRLPSGRLVLAIAYHSRWQGESEFSWAELGSAESLEEDFIRFESEFYSVFMSFWSDDNQSRASQQWEALAFDLKRLVSEVCETCGVAEDLDAPSEVS